MDKIKEEPIETLADLTNTTWVLSANAWSAVQGNPMIGEGVYAIYTVVNGEVYTHFAIGAYYEDDDNTIESDTDRVVFYDDANKAHNIGFYNSDTVTFKVVGGADVANADLISYLTENGALKTSTAEEVIRKITQANDNSVALVSLANAKTGKSDANLTDAVKTLLEGYGQGGGGGGGNSGGDCPINIVDELPATGEEGEIVGVKTFADMYIKGDADVPDGLMGELYKEYGIPMSFIEVQSIDDIPTLDSSVPFYAIYIKNIPDIFTSGGGGEPSSAGGNTGALFRGEITDVSQATEDGYYAYMKLVLYQYTNGEFKELVPEIPSYDGTITVV